MTSYLVQGFMLGLTLGLSCLSTCGPIYAPYLMMKQTGWLGSVGNLIQIIGGRFITYLAFGVVAGLLGQSIGNLDRTFFTPIAYIFFSILLLITAFRTHRHTKGCNPARWSRFADSPFLLGVFTGINFCPGFLIALTKAVELSGPVSGALFFFAFFISTTLFLLPLSVFGPLQRVIQWCTGRATDKEPVINAQTLRKVGVFSSVLVAVYFITSGVRQIVYSVQVTKNTVSIMDDSQACIFSADTAAFIQFRDKLAAHRDGPVFLAAAKEQLPEEGYIFVDHRWPESSGQPFDSLKSPGRFILILPSFEDTANVEEHHIDKFISFLKQFYFKFDRTSSTVFNLSHLVHRQQKAEKQE